MFATDGATSMVLAMATVDSLVRTCATILWLVNTTTADSLVRTRATILVLAV